MKLKAIFGGLLALAVIVLMIAACVWVGSSVNNKLSEINPDAQQNAPENPVNLPSAPTDAAEAGRIYLALGNPSNASTNPANPNNFLMQNPFYVISYNREKAIANWVAWRLTQNDFGNAGRQNDYRPNGNLPAGWTRVLPSDYSRSGFDRGHLCPSADRSISTEANSSTFLMTNMTPQTPELNQGPWEKLETYSRSMARRDTTLYIVAGQYGARGRVNNKVTIPTNFWKIIVAVPNNGDISAVNRDTRVIAVDMPNSNAIRETNWREFRTTVQSIEQKTGYRFFTNLPSDLQNVLKTKPDTR